MDLIDKKIICELDLNCRTPISRIAKKLRIGRNVANYRIKRLEKEGYIKNYISSLNLIPLGYKKYRIYFKIQQFSNQDKFVDFILKSKNVIHFIKTQGYFDYSITIAVKSIKELDNFLMEIRTKFKDIIKEHHISILIYTKIFKLSKLLLNKHENIFKTKKSLGKKEIKIDEKDKKILRTLSQNANISLLDLSEKTNLSLDIVKYRLKKLNNTLINSNRVILDINKLGYYHYIIMLKMNQITSSDQMKLDSWCTKKNNIIFYGKRLGNFDFELSVAIQSIEELNSFFAELKKEFGSLIDSYELIINSELLKLNYMPF